MTTLREAAQQALEALDEAGTYHRNQPDQRSRRLAAMATLRAALAQEQAEPVQEPVAWMLTDADNQRVKFLEWQKETRGYSGAWIKTPLYTAPPRCPNCASLEAQNDELDRKLAEMERAEPAAVVGTQVDVWRGWDVRWAPPGGPIKTALMLKDMPVGTMLYATPPKRHPLTEEEIKDCFHAARNAKLGASKDNSKHRLSVVEIARAIERAHGIIEPRIEEDSHQTLDDAMQQPRAMAQAYERGYKAGQANERERIIQFLQEMQRVVGDAHNHYGVAAVRIKEGV